MIKNIANDTAFQSQLLRTIGYASFGAAEVGECLTICEQIPAGDHETWFNKWWELALNSYEKAKILNPPAPVWPCDLNYLTASNYARTSFYFLDEENDNRVQDALALAQKSFKLAMSYSSIRYEYVQIPYEESTLPGILYFASNYEYEPRPLIIDTGGGDNIIEELFFNAQIAIRHGFHYLAIEGPGQGGVLRQRKIPLRHDWEVVIKHVINFCETQPLLKEVKKILYGMSFGGYLASRAATNEKRIDALIVDPGILNPMAYFFDQLESTVKSNILNCNLSLTEPVFEKLAIDNYQLYYMLKSRCFRFGAKNISEMFYLGTKYNLMREGAVKNIACPTLVIDNELEYLSKGQAKLLYNHLVCSSKKYICFDSKYGQGGHCQPLARRDTLETILLWLKSL